MTQEIGFWSKFWESGQTAWDLDGPHQLTAKLWQLAKPLLAANCTSPNVYVPGCGRAHDAAFFAHQGLPTVGADFSASAIQAAQAVYAQEPQLKLRTGDAAICPPAEAGQYDVIFDRAMLCALRPELRQDYLLACRQRLKSGGLFISLPFTRVTGEGGPPFAITPEVLRGYFAETWEVLHLSTTTDGHCDGKILQEALFIARRK